MLGTAEVLAILVEDYGGEDERSDEEEASCMLVFCFGKDIFSWECGIAKMRLQNDEGDSEGGLRNLTRDPGSIASRVSKVIIGINPTISPRQESASSKPGQRDKPEYQQEGIYDYDCQW